MDERPQSKPQKNFVTIEDLADQLFSQPTSGNLHLIEVREAKSWSMRWVVLGIAAGWIVFGTSASAILFLFTKSNLAFLPLTTMVATAPLIIRDISRYLFWRPEDYKLEELKQTLKTRKWELKYQSHQKSKA